jgi:protein-L-isoaspartate(D-aspartate) O-methyltransferase
MKNNYVRFVSFAAFCLLAFLVVNQGHCSRITTEKKQITDQRRAAMIETLIKYGITDQAVLDAMKKVKRHEFIPAAYRDMRSAYGDHPCPIGSGQTISQPYIVAYMTEKMMPVDKRKILEVGTGSGYQAAVLAELGAEVYSVEIVPELARHAKKALAFQNYDVNVKHGDGYKGWKEHAPFDIIIVTCAPESIPDALKQQLSNDGRMIVPVGPEHGTQRLMIIRKSVNGFEVEEDLPVRFVPMIKEK